MAKKVDQAREMIDQLWRNRGKIVGDDRTVIAHAMIALREMGGDPCHPKCKELLDGMAELAADPKQAKELANIIRDLPQ